MKVILGQGNPGDTYALTRHNIGFMQLDMLAREFSVSFVPKTKFQALIAEATVNGEKILLVKPQTYYNDTGLAARSIVDFYKLRPEHDLLVIHDELALPFGTIKTRSEGSDAGNNGIKSLNSHLTPNYLRIRIGIYNPLRERMDDADFVLAKFSQDERELFGHIEKKVQYFVDTFIREDFTTTKTTIL